MNIVRKIFLILLVIVLQSNIQSILHAQDLIDHGFVFVEGRYIEAPYQVTTKNLAIYLNGIKIIPEMKCSQANLWVITDPGMPQGMTKEMGISAINSLKNSSGYPIIIRKLSYFYQNFPKDIADEKATKFLSMLPFLRTFRLNDVMGSIYLEDYYDKSLRLDISGTKPLKQPTLEECVDIVNKNKQIFENFLKDGSCLFFSDHGSLTQITAKHAAKVLPKVISTLSDQSKNIEEKKAILDSCGIKPRTSHSLDELFNNFAPNNSLNRRIQEYIEFIKKNREQSNFSN
jgi:hypothetical protein